MLRPLGVVGFGFLVLCRPQSIVQRLAREIPGVGGRTSMDSIKDVYAYPLMNVVHV